MTRVKICGLRSPVDCLAVNESRPDYAGCILAAGFRRSISLDAARALRGALRREIPLVGVFVDDPTETILAALSAGIIDIAQLHGQECDAQISALQARSGKPIWKVFQMQQHPDYARIHACPADLVLLDAGAGSGTCFDWSQALQVKRPFILAGGLTPENVQQAIRQTHPFCVDTSSGVETGGRKDPDQIAAFVRKVRSDTT